MAISKYGSINEDGDSNDRENREVRSNHIHVEESQRYSNLRQAIAGKVFILIHSFHNIFKITFRFLSCLAIWWIIYSKQFCDQPVQC